MLDKHFRADAADAPIDELYIDWVFRMLDTDLAGIDADMRNVVDLTAYRIAKANKAKYAKGIYPDIGLNTIPDSVTADVIKNWTKANTDLITRTTTYQRNMLEQFFRDNAFSGRRASNLEPQLRKIISGTDARFKLIARDQTMKLGGQLDMVKQTSLGIPGYYWRSSQDERVRATHAEREGQYFRWDSPPPGGHPGQDYQCRCDAEPAIDMLLGDRDAIKELEIENVQDRKRAMMRSRDYQKKLRKQRAA